MCSTDARDLYSIASHFPGLAFSLCSFARLHCKMKERLSPRSFLLPPGTLNPKPFTLHTVHPSNPTPYARSPHWLAGSGASPTATDPSTKSTP